VRVLANGVLDGVDCSPSTRDAVSATLADWRHESICSTTPLARLVLAAIYSVAILRALIGGALIELSTEWRRPFATRLVWTMVFAALFAVVFRDPAFRPPLADVGLAWTGATDAILRLMPLLTTLVFLVEVTGSRQRPGVRLGTLLFLFVCGVLLVGIVAPEVRHYLAVSDWRTFGLVRDPLALSLPSAVDGLLGRAALRPDTYWWTMAGDGVLLGFSLAAMAALATRIRMAGQRTAWVIGGAVAIVSLITVELAYSLMALTGNWSMTMPLARVARLFQPIQPAAMIGGAFVAAAVIGYRERARRA
jgi:hypothetical protein